MDERFKKNLQYEFKEETAQTEKKVNLNQLPKNDSIHEKMYQRLKKTIS